MIQASIRASSTTFMIIWSISSFTSSSMTSTTQRIGGVLRILSNTKTGTAPTAPRTGSSMRTIQLQGMTIPVTAITDLAHTSGTNRTVTAGGIVATDRSHTFVVCSVTSVDNHQDGRV